MVKEYRINERIRSREVRVIGEKGEQLGVVPVVQALQMAHEKELDLVEVAPTAVPPVCRLLDYGKFRYQQAKKERESKKTQKLAEIREVRLRPSIDDHDLEVKLRNVKKLLAEGDKVKVTVVFRGREMSHMDLGMGLLRQVTGVLKADARLEKVPTMEGRRLSIILAASPVKPTKEDKGPKSVPEGKELGVVETQKV